VCLRRSLESAWSATCGEPRLRNLHTARKGGVVTESAQAAMSRLVVVFWTSGRGLANSPSEATVSEVTETVRTSACAASTCEGGGCERIPASEGIATAATV
jgi:hypothetical protein